MLSRLAPPSRPAPPRVRPSLVALYLGAAGCTGCPTPSGTLEAPPVITVLTPTSTQEESTDRPVPLCALIDDVNHSLASLKVSVRLDGQDLYRRDAGVSNQGATTSCAHGDARGNLGLELGTLTAGAHILEIDAEDPEGASARTEVHFSVRLEETSDLNPSPTPTAEDTATPPDADLAPTCAILRPSPGAIVSEGEPLTFEASVADGDDALAELVIRWTSTPEVAAISGQGGQASWTSATRFTTTDLPPGAFRVDAEVSDPTGALGTCGVDVVVLSCDDTDGDGYAPCEGDCDDGRATTSPEAADPTNGRDDDCDGATDEDADLPPPDADHDGYTADVDCDDTAPTVHPLAAEAPDHVDQDCDGLVDEGTAFGDDDLDGFTEAAGDCNDADPDLHPGAPEGAMSGGTVLGDGIDNNCDGRVDEGTDRSDDDGDGLSELLGDCDDAEATVRPGTFDDPDDGLDNDCNGVPDDGVIDEDHDGIAAAEDCDDQDAAVYPGADEACDGLDEDCDGHVDEDQPDVDGDGYPACASAPEGFDCADTDPGRHPGAPEGPTSGGVVHGDGLDSDCDGTVDEGTDRYDDDRDGYTELGGDCDDTRAAVHPGAPDGIGGGDQDCDGKVDEDALEPGDIVVTEVRRATYNEDTAGQTGRQWLELYNPSDRSISLAGWAIEVWDGHPDLGPSTSHVIDLGASAPVIPPQGFVVLGRDPDAADNGGVSLGAVYPDLVLGLSGIVSLTVGRGGALIDRVEWDDGLLYPIEEGASLNLSRDKASTGEIHLTNDQPQSWCLPASFYGRNLRGTPGALNDPC